MITRSFYSFFSTQIIPPSGGSTVPIPRDTFSSSTTLEYIASGYPTILDTYSIPNTLIVATGLKTMLMKTDFFLMKIGSWKPNLENRFLMWKIGFWKSVLQGWVTNKSRTNHHWKSNLENRFLEDKTNFWKSVLYPCKLSPSSDNFKKAGSFPCHFSHLYTIKHLTTNSEIITVVIKVIISNHYVYFILEIQLLGHSLWTSKSQV